MRLLPRFVITTGPVHWLHGVCYQVVWYSHIIECQVSTCSYTGESAGRHPGRLVHAAVDPGYDALLRLFHLLRVLHDLVETSWYR